MVISGSSAAHRDLSPSRALCPSWCVTAHGAALGEEDWLHASEPVRLTPDVLAHLVLSIDPGTCQVDGPYVIVGDTEFTLPEAAALAHALLALVTSDQSRPSDPAQG